MSNHNQQYSHIKRSVGDYIINYGLIQSTHPSYDTIDFFKINDVKYGLYLADIAGIDGNSNIINKLQHIINKNCLEFSDLQEPNNSIFNPAKVLQNINMEIYHEKLNRYVTIFYGILDLERNVLDYSIAGHYPNPMLIDAQLNARYIFSKGYPLGILLGATFENFSIELQDNDSIIIFSDGIMRFFKPDSMHEAVKDDSLLNLICNSKVEIADILEKLHLSYNTAVIDDIIIFTIKRCKFKN